jgi:hypothetical protein
MVAPNAETELELFLAILGTRIRACAFGKDFAVFVNLRGTEPATYNAKIQTEWTRRGASTVRISKARADGMTYINFPPLGSVTSSGLLGFTERSVNQRGFSLAMCMLFLYLYWMSPKCLVARLFRV